MELTKEECEIAWNAIKGLNYYPIKCTTNETQDNFQIIPFNELFSNEITLIDSIINEHFDSRPFKFEELKEEMVVWDSKQKDYIKIFILNNHNLTCEMFGTDTIDSCDFEENRFYRKEIK